MRRLVALALLAAPAMGGCGDPLGPERARLDQNLAKWRAAGIDSYVYEYRLNCFCAGPGLQPLLVEVRDGAVVEARRVDDQEPLPEEQLAEVPTVEALFERVREWLGRDSFRRRTEYDPALGYPRDVWFDFEENVIDEELGFLASGLEPL